jgi:tetratricopeptide (TPR) repeat protein
LDSLLFERLTAAGRSKMSAGRPADAEKDLAAALQLWRGPALVEFATEPFATDEAARLDALRVEATEAWAAAGLACGRGQELVAPLESLIERNPLREDLAAHLVVALYRSGRQADSLGACRAIRLRLRDELGIDPSPSLQDLELAVLRQDPKLLASTRDRSRPLSREHAAGEMPRQALIGGPSFAGRVDDLEWLDAAWVQSCQGQARLVEVRGEPGIGKTRLVSTFAARCHSEGAIVLWGRCFAEPLVPFQTLTEALRPLEPAGAASEALWDLWPRLEGESAFRSDLNTKRYLAFEAIANLLDEVSSSSPILLVLDDAHWADRPTLAFLSHMLRSARASALLVLSTARTMEMNTAQDFAVLVAELRQEGLAVSCSLGGLDDGEVATLITSIAGERTPPEFNQAVQARTDGNPLFVTELLRHLDEVTGGEYRYADADAADLSRLGVPEGIRTVIGHRLERLNPMTIDVVEVATVVSGDFDVELLDTILAGTGRTAIARCLDEAERAGLLRFVKGATTSYVFAHELLREAIDAGLGSARRALLHLQVGEAMETADNDLPLAQLAYHFAEAHTADSTTKAIWYSRQAGNRALETLAYEDAVSHVALAFDLCSRAPQQFDEELHADLLLLRARASFASGDGVKAKADFENAATIARRRTDPARLTDIALCATGTAMRHIWSDYGTVSSWVVELLKEALVLVGPDDSSARACLLARLAEELYFSRDGDTRTAFAHDAVAIARRIGDDRALAESLNSRLRSYWTPETAPERLATADELLEVASRCDDAELIMSAYAWRIGLQLELCLPDGVDDDVVAYTSMVKTYRSPRHQVWFRAILAGLALARGEFENTEQIIMEGMAIAPELFGYAVQGFAGQLCTLRIEQGRAKEMLDAARGFADEFPQVVAWRAGLSVILAELGRGEEARSELKRVIGNGLETVRRDQEWLFTMGALAETCSIVDDATTAARIYEELAPFADRAVVLGEGYVLWCSAHKSLGILARTAGQPDRACEHLARALEVHRAFSAHALVARTMFEQARALKAAHAPATAIGDALNEALALATALGQNGLIRSIEQFDWPEAGRLNS